jgi:predicted DNA-binding transcriptional regulator AlpA
MAEEYRRLLSRREAAAWLGMSKNLFLDHLADGDGPVFYMIGKRAKYSTEDLRVWMEARRQRGQTQVAADPVAEQAQA